MLVFTFFFCKRWGVLIPLFTIAAYFLATLTAKLFHVAPAYEPAWILAAGGLFTGLSLWIADNRIQESSGIVSYDAENDCPVVEEETSGTWMFVTFRGWIICWPALSFVLAGLSYLAAVKA